MKTNKIFLFTFIYSLLGISILYLLSENISDIKTNKNNIYSEYLEMKEIIDLYHTRLPKCVDISTVLNKNLDDDIIRKYEDLELKYALKKNKECVEDINNLINNLGDVLKDMNYDEVSYKKTLEMQKKKASLKSNLEKVNK